MGFESLFPNLPFYISGTLLLSYILWTKFLNKGKLIPIKSDGLLEIGAIFFIIFLPLVLFPFMIFSFSKYINLEFNLDQIVNSSLDFIRFMIIVLTIMFIAKYTNKKVTKKELKNILSLNPLFYLVLAFFHIGEFMFISLTPYTYLYGGVLLMMLITLLLILFGFYMLSTSIIKNVFNVRDFSIAKNLRKLMSKKLKKVINCDCLIILFFFVSGILSGVVYASIEMPLIKVNTVQNLSYELYDIMPSSGNAYMNIKIPITIKTFGIVATPITNLIPLKYSLYNISISEEYASKNFMVFVNTTKFNEPQKIINEYSQVKKSLDISKFGFKNLYNDEERGLIALRFDPNNVKKEEVNEIILQGYVPQSVNQLNFTYYDNLGYSNGLCNQNHCSIMFNISNNLNLPVHLHRDNALINFGIINSTWNSCIFTNVTASYSKVKNVSIQKVECNKDKCMLYLNRGAEFIFSAYLYIEENEVVRYPYMNFESPIEVFAKFDIDCK